MAIDTKTPYGNLKIDDNVIASIVAQALLECYGVVGLAESNVVRVMQEEKTLKEKDYKKGIRIRKSKNGYSIDVFIACAFGVKISEVVSQVQKKIRYEITKQLGIKLEACNVYVQLLKEIIE